MKKVRALPPIVKFLKVHRWNVLEICLAVLIGITFYGLWNSGKSIPLKFSDQLIKIQTPDKFSAGKYNAAVIGQEVTVKRGAERLLHGYLTANRDFLKEVMAPTIAAYLEQLRALSPVEQINQLCLAGFALYQAYFGKDFYRSGGDLLDLNDPQETGERYQYKYGLDAAGLVTLPYELALYLGLLKPTAPGAELASKGFMLFCQRTGFKDEGGRMGGNRYRLDVIDLAALGKEVCRIPLHGNLPRKQLRQLQPGDIVISNECCGILVEINGKLYYLESGGWVLPRFKYRPVRADIAIKHLVSKQPVVIRRALPERQK